MSTAGTDWLQSVRFDADGLVPAIAQDAATHRVLTLAWMNRLALERTVATREAHYWSRSRATLWHKGEQSGHVQRVHEIRLDCDGDAILLVVEPADGVLQRLAATIESRKGADASASYVAALLAKGEDAVLKKIGEEATETVMAAKDGDKIRVVAEVADLWFHCLVLLARHGLGPADVLRELARREGVSGHAERASRP
jgi:phosphoribosyl-ATP pyrophosphohydrolase/phosphoribosyl-AMP cyclohydrolase